MTLILAFIASHMGFLWVEARFRITGSTVTASNGGDALLVAESDILRLRFVCDRMQLFLELQPSDVGTTKDWFSVDLVRRLLLDQPEASGLLDESYARFVDQHLSEIEARFRRDNWPETYSSLGRLKAQRAQELFG